jgi:hypothetical protein
MITFQMTVPAEVVSHFGFLKKEANLPPRAEAGEEWPAAGLNQNGTLPSVDKK